MKPDCFVIMPIKKPEIEFLWDQVYKPVINDTGFKPIRIDEQDDGTSVHSQIENFLRSSPLVVADLSLARPNCYFEVGFVMGLNGHPSRLNRYPSLILCCREDHNPDSQNFNPTQNMVHFDVSTYYVIWWCNDKLDNFRNELKEKILRRKPRVLEKTEISETMAKPTKVLYTPSDSLKNLIGKATQELKEWKKQN